jgi:hypothetical protein
LGVEKAMDLHQCLLREELQARGVKASPGQLKYATKFFGRSYGPSHIKLAGALVKTAYEQTARPRHPIRHVYAYLCLDPSPTPGKAKLAAIAFGAWGKVLEKQGTFNPLSRVSGFAGSAAKMVPDIARTLALASAAGGAVLGAGTWGINRSLLHQDRKIREKEIQRDAYLQLTKEIREELERRGLDPTPKNVAKTVDYLT